MLLPGSFSAALLLMLLCMICWGSWTNCYRLARNWRLEFFHADYAAGLFLIAVAAAVTAGSMFGPHTFLDNLRAADSTALICAAAGGVALNIGNFLLMAGIARVGMTVAFPISVGFALVVSTVLSYLIQPLGDPWLLGLGVALVFCAVLANSLAFKLISKTQRRQSNGGLTMCFAAGLLFSAAGPLVAQALSTARPLSPYGTGVLYAGGSLAVTIPLLLYLSRRPLDGPRFSGGDYRSGSARNHLAGFAGGIVWGGGMVFGFLAAGFAGMAVAGAVGQANPLVAAAWGVLVWKEFRGATRRTYLVLSGMVILYGAGLILLARSLEAR